MWSIKRRLLVKGSVLSSRINPGYFAYKVYINIYIYMLVTDDIVIDILIWDV